MIEVVADSQEIEDIDRISLVLIAPRGELPSVAVVDEEFKCAGVDPLRNDKLLFEWTAYLILVLINVLVLFKSLFEIV